MLANVIFIGLFFAAICALAIWNEGPRTCGLCNGTGIGTNDAGETIKCPLCKNGSL